MQYRYYVSVCSIVAVAAVASVAWWWHTRAHTKISLLSAHKRPSHATAPSVSSESPSNAGAPDRPGASTESLDGDKFIADLDREIHLTEQQRSDLVRVFRQVAAMQARIDLYEDPDERTQMQDKLTYQLVLRLRLILGEEAAKRSELVLEKKPRIVYK